MMKIHFFVIFIQIWLIAVVAELNRQNYFQNFNCDNPQKNSNINNCKVTKITSAEQLETIFIDLASMQFRYGTCDYNCYYDDYHKVIRKDITEYPNLTFEDSNFAKFPAGTFSKLSNVKYLKAQNVNLSEINRDDLKSFKSVTNLDLSYNNIKTLGNVVFLYLESLESLYLQHNEIESIHENAFEECSKVLSFVNLSYNKLKQISENLMRIIAFGSYNLLDLSFNEIEMITPSAAVQNSTSFLKALNLSNNKLKSFKINSTIEYLYLDCNSLEDLSIGKEIQVLNVTNNNLINFDIPSVSSLLMSNNQKLANLTLKMQQLENLDIQNLPAGIFTFDMLKNASKLTYLNAKNTFLGAISIDTFSEMDSLETLVLSNTGLSHIEYGMFSHQPKLVTFDISNNNLGTIDIKMMTSMKLLKELDISGNNLTNLEHANEINKIFVNLEKIGVSDNNWNCSYLASLYKIMEENSILIKQPMNAVRNSSNVMGIGCMTTSQLKIKPLDADNANEALVQKMNEIIEDMNAEKVKNSNKRYDGDIIRSELYHIRSEILELKSRNLKDQLVPVGNETKELDLTVVRNMMEQLNNLTLEKQKLAIDQLQLKIDQLHIELTKKDLEHENFVHKSSIKDILSDNSNKKNDNVKYEYIKSADGNAGNNSTHTMLIILITSLVIFAAVFGYANLKKYLVRRNPDISVRARSTNTINTTVDIPFN